MKNLEEPLFVEQWPLRAWCVGACHHPPTTHQAVDRLAIAYSLAQSVRLSYWEQRIDLWVAATRTIPEDMAHTGAASCFSDQR